MVAPPTSLEEGRKAVLISMDSTLRSNLSVGMPLDLLTIRTDGLCVETRERIKAGDASFTALSEAWSRTLREGFHEPPLTAPEPVQRPPSQSTCPVPTASASAAKPSRASSPSSSRSSRGTSPSPS